MPMNWTIAHASVRGRSHFRSGKPCEDAVAVGSSQDKNWAIAVLCDGAGSAKCADEGARFASSSFLKSLEKISQKLDDNQPGPWLTDQIAQEIINFRSSLRQKVGDANMRDYHCTLVACLLSDTGGFAVHIGDGAIFGEDADRNEILISAPENGQYANETFFITEPHWIKHLRVTPISKMRWVALCTDGGAALTMQNEKNMKKGFVYPCIEAILSDLSASNTDKVVSDFLSDPKADDVTADDKSLVFILSSELDKNEFQYSPSVDAPSITQPPQSGPSEGVLSSVKTRTRTPRAKRLFPKKNILMPEKIYGIPRKTALLTASISISTFVVFIVFYLNFSGEKNANHIIDEKIDTEICKIIKWYDGDLYPVPDIISIQKKRGSNDLNEI